MVDWLVLKKGDVIVIDPNGAADNSIKALFKGRKIIVEVILWGACYCECGHERRFDFYGTCLTCGKLCKQYLLIDGRDYKSEFFMRDEVTEI